MNPLKPVRFYGSALPRPRYVEDGELSHERVDPPAPVNDSLLKWAKDANWSMGGLSFKRVRMQGKIEGRLSKLKNYAEDDDEGIPQKPKRRPRASPSKGSPEAALKKASSTSMKRKGYSGAVKGQHGKDALETPLVLKKAAAIHPLGPWGEEDGPTSRRVSPRLHASTPSIPLSPIKPLSQSSPPGAPTSNVSQSIEFPVQRRRLSRGIPDEDTDSEVNWEEFSRLRNKPLRRSSRVTSVRRSFKDFTVSVASDSDHEETPHS
jgi:hypothetical protein